MSEEELNQELSNDQLNEVSGGFEVKVDGQIHAKRNDAGMNDL